MLIGLIDVDKTNYPNLALMKISQYHKKNGDVVEWYTPFCHYDIVYISKVFSFSNDNTGFVNADKVYRDCTYMGHHIFQGEKVYMCLYDIINGNSFPEIICDNNVIENLDNCCDNWESDTLTDTSFGR